MKGIMRKLLTYSIFLIGLAGCASEHLPPPPQNSDPASVKLAEAASSVSQSLAVLEGIKKAEMPNYQKKLPDPVGLGLNGLVSIDWSGPIGPLVEKFAELCNYRLRVLGHSPAIPILISLHKVDVPLGSIIRDTDYQAGEKADIMVYPRSKTIELRYKNLAS